MEEIKNKAPDTRKDKQGEQSNIDFSDDILLRDEPDYFNGKRCCLHSYLKCQESSKHCNECGSYRRKARANLHYFKGNREDLPSIQPRYKSELMRDRKKINNRDINSIWREAAELLKKKGSDVLE